MALWSWDGVVASRRYCMDGGLQRELVYFHMLYSLFGPIPRTIFATLRPPLKYNSKVIIPTTTSPRHSAATGISVFHTVRPITAHVIDLLVAATVAEDAKKGISTCLGLLKAPSSRVLHISFLGKSQHSGPCHFFTRASVNLTS